MLDIEALRLTDEEEGLYAEFELIDAQLTQVLWGIVDWLEDLSPWDRVDILEDHLLAASRPRPEA